METRRIAAPALMVLSLVSLLMAFFGPEEKAVAVHSFLTSFPFNPVNKSFGPAAMFDGAKVNVTCVSDNPIMHPFILSHLSLDTTLDAGDDLNIDQIMVDGDAITDGDSSSIAEINVNSGALRSNPPIIPLAIPHLAADRTVLFFLDQQAGNIADDTVTGTALIYVRRGSAANCTMGLNP